MTQEDCERWAILLDRKEARLPPFNPAARCPKCGYDLVTTTYRARTFTFFGGNLPEALVRTCIRCSYSWDEKVAS